MPDVHLNYLAIVVAAVVYFFIGFIWYSFLFRKPWGEMMGFNKLSKKEQEEKRKTMGRSMFFNFLMVLLTAYCMAWSVASGAGFYHIGGVALGLQTGFWIWLGFIVTSMLNSVLWEGRPVKLYLINIGYYLVSFLAVGTILAVWQ